MTGAPALPLIAATMLVATALFAAGSGLVFEPGGRPSRSRRAIGVALMLAGLAAFGALVRCVS